MLNDAGERQIAMAALARRYPQSRLVFTGGSGNLGGGSPSESEIVGATRDQMGLPRTRLILEDRSRNTRENAAFTADMVKPKPGERWLLVTSAWHMPRSHRLLPASRVRRHGLPGGLPHRGVGRRLALQHLHVGRLMTLDLMTKEWIGLVAYRLAGYTDAWLPAPQASSGAVATGPSR